MKRVLLFAWVLMFLLAACGPQTPAEDPNLVYTQAAGTVVAQLTAVSALTPSVTPSLTPEPTATVTETPVPTETPAPTPTPSPTWIWNPAGKATAPILAYGTVGEGSSAEDDTPVEVFDQHLLTLQQAGYTPITLAQLSEAVYKGANLPQRPVVITFDKNSAGIYTQAFPRLQKYGYVATVFTVVNEIDTNGKLTTQQLKDLAAAGWEIGSSGMSRINLTGMPELLSQEIAGSREELQKKLGVPITSFAYPGGAVNDFVAARVANYGYYAGATLLATFDHYAGSLFYLGRFAVRNNQDMTNFLAMLPWKPAAP